MGSMASSALLQGEPVCGVIRCLQVVRVQCHTSCTALHVALCMLPHLQIQRQKVQVLCHAKQTIRSTRCDHDDKSEKCQTKFEENPEMQSRIMIMMIVKSAWTVRRRRWVPAQCHSAWMTVIPPHRPHAASST